jgi:hypothetical protein
VSGRGGVGARGTAWARGAAGACVAVACASLLAACASPMSALAGERAVGVNFTGAPAGGGAAEPVRVPAVFTLHNKTWGGIRIESVRAPVGTEVSTIPPLPATIPGGGRLEVAVIASFRPGGAGGVRRILLECAGQPPLELTVASSTEGPAPKTDLPLGATTK